MNVLTTRQRDLLNAIRESMATRGYPPTVAELGATVGLASREVVARQLRILRFKGAIEPVAGTNQVRINLPQEAGNG